MRGELTWFWPGECHGIEMSPFPFPYMRFLSEKLFIFAPGMMKRLVYFLMIFCVFLMSEGQARSDNRQEYKPFTAICLLSEDDGKGHVIEKDTLWKGKDLPDRGQGHLVNKGYLRRHLFRDTLPLKYMRTNPMGFTDGIIPYHQESFYSRQRRSLLFSPASFLKFSRGYYIYSLRRLLL